MIVLLAAALQFPDWKHPRWGAGPAEVSAALGLPADSGEAREDIRGMQAKVRGPLAYGPHAVMAKLFFKDDRLAVITLKLARPEACEGLDLQLASTYGRPLLYRHYDGGVFVDAWDARNGDRITLSGGAGRAGYCDMTIGPPRRDRFNTY